MPWSWSNIDWNGTGAMVQALGSVAAIGAAAWIAHADTRRNRDAAKRELARRAELICSLAWQISDFAREAFYQQIRNGGAQLTPENLDATLVLVDRFPVEHFPSGELAVRFTGLRRRATDFSNAHREWTAYKRGRGGLGTSLGTMSVLRDEIATEYDALIECAQAVVDAEPGPRVTIPTGYQPEDPDDVLNELRAVGLLTESAPT